MAARLRGRPAHAPGPTFLSYTPNGKKLVTVGLNGALRVFQHGYDGEPATIDVNTEEHLAVAAANDWFLVGTEDGSVTKYSLVTNQMEEMLVRCTLPVRDIALSPDGAWAAVSSDEVEVKVVNTQDMTQVLYLREHRRPAKNVSFDATGSTIAVSCTDGIVYMYSISSQTPQLLKRIDGLIKTTETESDTNTRVSWHVDGRAFAAPTATRDFQVVARSDWSHQKAFKGGHRGDITAATWSPNGALLVTAGADKSLVLWETKTQSILKSFDDVQNVILEMAWHPTENVLSYTNNNGELFIREDFVPGVHAKLLKIVLQPAPFNNDPLSDISGNAQRPMTNGLKPGTHASENDYIDSLLDDAMSEDGADFIEDDDGAGYAEEPNRHGKRVANTIEGRQAKRPVQQAIWQPKIHESFQPGSTPWKGNRRYLCLNLTGFVWTVDQETHHTVTVEFYDRQEHRDFHFTDPHMYDKACLNEKGALFSCPPSTRHPAVLHYRPHETWTSRTDWRTHLPAGEQVTSMSLSDSCIVATTSAGYVRVYSLFGLPLKIYRQKSMPAVACASWRDYVMTVGNGSIGGDGRTRLLYTIDNVKRDESCQSEDVLPLPEDVELKSVFFSDNGDPCIYDTAGVLLILHHWRTPGQAKWVPLLDTKTLERLAGGKKEESYWPIAVANNKFHCIILKGGEEYPYFPRPLLSDFDFSIPVSASTAGEEDDKETTHQKTLEEQYVRACLQHSLHMDLLENTNATHAQRQEVPTLEREVDKVLLQLLATECREGEEHGMKALEIATLMKDRTGKMLEAAGKIASRFHRDVLGDKIMQLAERRLVGLVSDDDV
ncbi:WD40-repeat-containing domain protein [Neohortaea acidophila]|uniref:WD40-repeat-containing domain protein n=1 Tax=Neohortaea acidophila TaxID=245834 RepID=A0A6A6PFX8_9PEZI|nr:WD40-repeat-containing domain protein [Neohortaea acidophila]KAF2478889.1 WD40-repeat-containing domain protein [Neohortaea acidophila]